MALVEELKELTTGIYVLTVREGDVRHGMSSSWVTQVSGEPPLLMASVDPHHFSHGIIERTGRFGLNVVGRNGRSLEDYFYSSACRKENNLEDLETEESPEGMPFLVEAMLSLECRVVEARRAGDHTMYVAGIDSVRRRAEDTPLTSLDLDYVYLGTGRIVKR